MPNVAAMLVASVAGWLVEGAAHGILGPVGSMIVSLLATAVAFFFAKRILTDLRG